MRWSANKLRSGIEADEQFMNIIALGSKNPRHFNAIDDFLEAKVAEKVWVRMCSDDNVFLMVDMGEVQGRAVKYLQLNTNICRERS